MTDAQLYEIGRKSREGVEKLTVRGFENWAVFSRSLGFFKWRQKLALTDAQVEVFRKGFCGEPL